MRGLVRGLIGLLVLWVLYWALAAWGLRQSLESWFAAQEARGWQVETGEIAFEAPMGGFPLQHRTRVTLPMLADPASGVAWRADWLSFESPAIWPGHQTLRFADGEQRLSWYDRTAVIGTEGLTAALSLAPGLALEVEEMSLTSGPWQIGNEARVALSAEDLELRMSQGAEPELYAIRAEAKAFRPGEELRRQMRSAPELPQTFSALTLEAEVRFDRAWDRQALEERRPQPRHINLNRMEAHWGAMRILSTGALDVDEAGIPTGEIALQVEDWQAFLDVAMDTGALQPGARDQMARVIGLLARAKGNPEDLDITLSFRDGAIWIGPLPLGKAPRLILH
ncbi:DUF2125 domain-containing protein [Arenibacterium sp. LLYu02]|uniref:DUF2125 domain-containing protein n=1 Tax=Arenibacterium sp. LLYu02 TaxID=3404132 RepID=UPI003B20FFA2